MFHQPLPSYTSTQTRCQGCATLWVWLPNAHHWIWVAQEHASLRIQHEGTCRLLFSHLLLSSRWELPLLMCSSESILGLVGWCVWHSWVWIGWWTYSLAPTRQPTTSLLSFMTGWASRLTHNSISTCTCSSFTYLLPVSLSLFPSLPPSLPPSLLLPPSFISPIHSFISYMYMYILIFVSLSISFFCSLSLSLSLSPGKCDTDRPCLYNPESAEDQNRCWCWCEVCSEGDLLSGHGEEGAASTFHRPVSLLEVVRERCFKDSLSPRVSPSLSLSLFLIFSFPSPFPSHSLREVLSTAKPGDQLKHLLNPHFGTVHCMSFCVCIIITYMYMYMYIRVYMYIQASSF